MASVIPEWFAGLPQRDGLTYISDPRRFAHDEEKYDQQYRSDPANMKVGRGLVRLLGRYNPDLSGPALEVGCGTGLLSLGLAAESPYPLTILTDPSPVFLRLTRKKIEGAGSAGGVGTGERLAYAVLLGEEIDRLPPESVSLIVLRSTLHHILEVDDFIAAAARALRPGGILTFEEPCLEGYVLMGAMMQFLPVLARGAGRPLTGEQERQVDLFVRTMAFYARRDVDKRQAEDKHLFRVDELMRTGARCGLDVDFRANRSYEAFEKAETVPAAFLDYMRRWLATRTGLMSAPMREGRKWYLGFMRGYARYCMSWDEGLMAAFDEFMPPYCGFVQESSMGGSGPYLHGVFVCKKAGRGAS